ncbi:hypothetical protein Pflav_073400 [Phytohabitans flavus]|uniref:Uncharacterized protein n=2 Tax=Phytohabitans flavus TaxID=1076124 RepID=A0A6F8Y4E3_9ACTN|nr:hypothetical protein Pflav_073400 [Phytohabitans flavus]
MGLGQAASGGAGPAQAAGGGAELGPPGAAVRDSARQRVPVWDLASQWVAGRDLAIRLAEAVALGWANHQAEAASQG